MVLFLREVHRVIGAREEDFEAAFRDADGWMGLLAATTDDARLAWYCSQAHGSGPSYTVVTVTVVADGSAWEQLALRVKAGDLRDWAAHIDTLRHDVRASLLLNLPWSPLHDVDLAAVPTSPASHGPSLYLEDTMWPFPGRLHEYIDRAGTAYRALLERPGALLELQGAFQPALGGGRRSITLMQKVRRPEGLVSLLAGEVPSGPARPGSWMHDALELRDQWESRLLRTAGWSPWW